jgi:uncharacterized protein
MIGPTINGGALVLGSLLGAAIGPKLNKNLRQQIPQVFGCAALGIGVVMITKVHAFAPVVLALILGAAFGILVRVEDRVQRLSGYSRKLVDRIAKPAAGVGQEEFLDKFVALVVLFCVSGMGVYGSLSEGMTGDFSLLVIKAILDFFTALIFASNLGFAVCLLAIPQFAVQALLYLGATQIVPLTTPEMMADFSACGGLIMLATGFRICGIKPFPVADMIPALLLVMPVSWAWTALVV